MAGNHSVAMQIGDVAKLTAVSVDAIRFYERHSLLAKAPRTPGRFRLYSKGDVARLKFIKQMQGLGFSLSEVRQLLDLRDQSLDACPEVRELLCAKLSAVRVKIGELKELEKHLTTGLRKCNDELKRRGMRSPRGCPVLADGPRMDGRN